MNKILGIIAGAIVLVIGSVSMASADPLPPCTVSLGTLYPPNNLSLVCEPYTAPNGTHFDAIEYRFLT